MAYQENHREPVVAAWLVHQIKSGLNNRFTRPFWQENFESTCIAPGDWNLLLRRKTG